MIMNWLLAATQAAPAAAAQGGNNLFVNGLIVTAFGLLGVFLVLTLFYITIKLMQKIGGKEKKQSADNQEQ